MTTEEKQPRQMDAVDHHFRDSDKREEAKEVYLYKDAELREQLGYIPFWLQLVAVSLLLWGLYYLVTYWTPD